MTAPMISVRDLHRSFEDVQAVRGVSFDILRGHVVGFIGANGAGKTTTMRIMVTLDLPTAGSIEIGGCDVVNFPTEVRRRIGWMPDSYGTYQHMTVLEYLDFYARSYGFTGQKRSARLREVIDFTELGDLTSRPVDHLSKGMAQRLCLGRTLLHDPEVLVLDEPAAGLDPKARIEFKRLVRLLAAEGKTIFISSHILSELAEVCDSLLFIDAGRIVHHGSVQSLQQYATSAQTIVDIQVANDPETLHRWIELHPGVKLVDTHKQGARVTFDTEQPAFLADILKKMIADGVAVSEFHRAERKLEDAFVEMLKKLDPSPSTPPPLPPS
jgi:ABC-2 type transport system ATP-binding protein